MTLGRPPLDEDERERNDDDTTPSSAPIVADDRNATDPDPRPVLSFDIPTENPRIRAMFDNMKMRRAPPPVESPITNGELAAAYSSDVPRPAPAPNPTPPPQPPVILAAPTPVPEPAPQQTTPPTLEPVAPPALQPAAARRIDAVTVRIERPIERLPMNRRGILTLALVAAVGVAAILSLALYLARGPHEQPAATATTAPASMQAPPATTAPPSVQSVVSAEQPSSPSQPTASAVTVAAPRPSPPSARTRSAKPATSKNHGAPGLQNWLDE